MIQLLQNAPSPAGGGLLSLAPMIFIFVIFYFILIAPMRKKQKKTQEMLSKLDKGAPVTLQLRRGENQFFATLRINNGD